MKRICIQWPTFGPYYMARLRTTAQAFAERGVELVGIETAGDMAAYAWSAEEGAEGFRRVQLFPGEVFEELHPPAIHRAMHAALERLQPDAIAIHSYFLPDTRAALTWARRNHRVVVTMVDSKADDAPRSGWREALKGLIIRETDAALVAGQPHQAYLEGFGLPSEVIFHGYDVVDNAFFAEGARAARAHPETTRHLPGLADDTPFFLVSSRFIPRKNLSTLFEAYRRYRLRTEQPWRLVVLGDGRLRPEYEAFIAEHDLGGVTLAGRRPLDDLPAYYGRAGAFVLPSEVDQWGLVVNEAMAAGLPVAVSTGAGCAVDLVEEGANGFRFAPHDTRAITDVLIRLAAPDTDRTAMGQRSEAIIAAWTPERFAESLWDAVQAGRPRSRRSFGLPAQLVLIAMRLAARSVYDFGSVEM